MVHPMVRMLVLATTETDSCEISSAVVIPSFGAALNAIRMQGDFDTVARRSLATESRLIAIRAALHAPGLDFARLADLVQKTAEVMGADVSEWRTLFRTRPLSLPA